MTTRTQEPSLIWVCTTCYEAHHGVGEEWTGETQHPHPDAAFYVQPYTPPEPLNLISEDAEVTAGLLWEEHGDECENRKAREWVTECECERITHSTSACQGCGSHLHGAREALTVWHNEEN